MKLVILCFDFLGSVIEEIEETEATEIVAEKDRR